MNLVNPDVNRDALNGLGYVFWIKASIMGFDFQALMVRSISYASDLVGYSLAQTIVQSLALAVKPEWLVRCFFRRCSKEASVCPI